MDRFSSQSWKVSSTRGRFTCIVCDKIGRKSDLSIHNAVRHFKVCHEMDAKGSKLHKLQKKWRKRYDLSNKTLKGNPKFENVTGHMINILENFRMAMVFSI